MFNGHVKRRTNVEINPIYLKQRYYQGGIGCILTTILNIKVKKKSSGTNYKV